MERSLDYRSHASRFGSRGWADRPPSGTEVRRETFQRYAGLGSGSCRSTHPAENEEARRPERQKPTSLSGNAGRIGENASGHTSDIDSAGAALPAEHVSAKLKDRVTTRTHPVLVRPQRCEMDRGATTSDSKLLF